MKKIGLGILIGVAVLALSGIVAAAPWDKGGEVSYGHVGEAALANANEKAVFFRYEAGTGFLKGVLKIRHEFPNGFTANVTDFQLGLLNFLGVETEEVPVYYVLGKPGCTCDDDNICEPDLGEHPSCCDACKGGGEEEPPPERSCYPSTSTPWGIVKVNGGTGGSDIDVAVLDTGVYRDHLDLTRRIVDCKDFTKGPKPKNNCKDGYGHGTHIAGTILADGGEDGLGIFGVAPQADLMAYKVCGNSGACWTDDIAAAIDYAASQGAEIVSMSLGGDVQSSLIKEAIDRNPGVLYVAAAGNDGPADGSIDYPGAYVKVMAAGAIDSTEAVPDWSSRGINDGDYVIEEREVELGTPGVSVESTYNDGCYTYMSGTSMATPHVSGLAAKLWDIADGTLDGLGNAADTRSYLQSIAKDIWETGDDTATGFGLPVAP